MVNVTVDDRELGNILRLLGARGFDPRGVVRRVVSRRVRIVKGQAVNKAPLAKRRLRDSAQARTMITPEGVLGYITFGNLGAAYAEYQHEGENLRHTLPPGVSRTHYVDRRGRRKKRKHPLKGYRGGQAKFLYGRKDSAWNDDARNTLQGELLQAAYDAYSDIVGGRPPNV